jgi:asparagine synthase (glutamine-hydrolysing)
MCGIAGAVAPRNGFVDPATIGRMQDLLHHRGPDGQGMFVEPNVVLAMRRLAVIDIAGGEQPISNEDGTVWIVYNGEIYNFQEMRDRLVALGHTFRTNSDTEMIVHAYEQYGTACVQHFRGMFAFAIWDKTRERLLLARDRVGKKPLLYSIRGESLIFASEFRAMLAHPDVSREIDPNAIHHYLSFMCVPAPLTAYRDIRKLEPGHLLTWEKGRVSIERYWSLDFTKKIKITEHDAAEETIRLLREAVRLRMIADVPVGAFLSGGVDSSAVVALMSQLSSRPVKTFSIGFDDARYDELHHARRVANAFGTEHHEFVVRSSAAEVLPLLVDHYGEPYADSSAVPTYFVARETRQHVTVALNGDGGDEGFGGYRRYKAMKMSDWLRRAPAPMRKLAARATQSISSTGQRRDLLGSAQRFTGAAMLPRDRAYMNLMCAFDDAAKERMYTREFGRRVGSDDSVAILGRWICDERLGIVDALLQTDTMTYLPNDLLVKVDIASMAVSLEARSPLLDHQVLEFAASLPPEMKLRRLKTKYILKKALRGLVPQVNLERRKMGFGVPVGEWLRHDLKPMVQQLLLPDRVRSRGILQPATVDMLVNQHMRNERDWTNQLWTLLMLELWFQRFIDTASIPDSANCSATALATE